MLLRCLLLFLRIYIADGHYETSEHGNYTVGPDHESRRIINGREAGNTRPYMVYLRPMLMTKTDPRYPNWLCGGVIIHERYILTSAACIEDIGHFYVVSGTHNWVPNGESTDCIKYGAVKAVWKCVPKTYRFDGNTNDNIMWMANDIAIVMTAEAFNFAKRVRGCDFIPKPIAFNKDNVELENKGVRGYVVGWGSTGQFNDPADAPLSVENDLVTKEKPIPATEPPYPEPLPVRMNMNTPQLMEADVEIISKDSCKSFWMARYHTIIEENMICGRKVYDELHAACEENQMECRELVISAEQQIRRRKRAKRKSLRRIGRDGGGFCENDHGGPLITGHGATATVIGIISAYRVENGSTRCVGPFLYTSVYNNRHLINCAISREVGRSCRRLLRTSITVLDQQSLLRSELERVESKPESYKTHKKKHHKSKRKSHHTKTMKSRKEYPVKLVGMNKNIKISKKKTTTESPTDSPTKSSSKSSMESLSKESDMSIAIEVRRQRPLQRRRDSLIKRVRRRSVPPSIRKSTKKRRQNN